MYRLTYLNDFLHLFYPKVCIVCPDNLIGNEQIICTSCLHSLPKTNFIFGESNPIEQIFWGRTPIKAATALYWFEKGGAIQQVLHQLKYKQNKEVGQVMGELLGMHLKSNSSDLTLDAICAVPLHAKKQKIRGYNQSELIANGVCSTLELPLEPAILSRKKFTETQTAKSKIDRWENVKDVFEVKHPNKVQNKHFLLIDDVITTGATLEACAKTLLNHKAASVSIATLAYTAM